MVIYTLSSTDPKHYNRIQVKLPVEFASRFVNVCVTSLTSNCNIEVMNEADYITFLIEETPFKVMMTPYSKLTTASLPYILQDIFNQTPDLNITASVSNLDTLILTCEKQFVVQHEAHHRLLFIEAIRVPHKLNSTSRGVLSH